MRSVHHILAAAPLGLAVHLATGRPDAALAAGLTSVLVDLDHVPEYLFWRGRRASLKDFFASYHGHRVPWVVMALHGWECLAVGAGLLLLFLPPLWAFSLAAGWLFHLVCDQAGNPAGAGFYFFTYRALKKFRRADMQGRWGLSARPKTKILS